MNFKNDIAWVLYHQKNSQILSVGGIISEVAS